MSNKSKAVVGQPRVNLWKNQGRMVFDPEAIHLMIQEYLTTDATKTEIWKKHTGRAVERGHLTRWMRKLGYADKPRVRAATTPQRRNKMSEKLTKEKAANDALAFKIRQLENRNEELEAKVREAEMKALTFSTMIDLAEEHFKVPIRKKSAVKPSKK